VSSSSTDSSMDSWIEEAQKRDSVSDKISPSILSTSASPRLFSVGAVLLMLIESLKDGAVVTLLLQLMASCCCA
jgi:hypothetical protein